MTQLHVRGRTGANGGAQAPRPSVADQIRRCLSELTPAERKAARTLLTGYPAAGLGTVADLAAESFTSSATVVRLAQKLGFEGYPQLQSALRSELTIRSSGPVDRLEHADPGWSGPGTLARLSTATIQTVGTIVETVPESEFDAAVDLIADPKRRIRLLGGRVSGLLAEYLHHHLSRARGETSIFPMGGRGRHSTMLDIGRRDVLVVFDVRRYETEVVAVAEAAAGRGASVVLVTDVFMSPAAAVADVVLPVRVDAPSPFDSSVATLVVIEALATAVIATLEPSSVRRMREWDALADAQSE